MIDKTALSVHKRARDSHGLKRLGGLLDILVVFAPIVVLGSIGTRLGGGTPLGAIVITLAYVLSVVMASIVLRSRGTGWREIGLARPGNWRRTILLGVATMVVALFASTAIEAIAVNMPGAAIEPSDQSRFNPIEGNVTLLLLYLLAAWTTVPFGEEMLFRAFLTDRLATLFEHTRARWALALIGSSVAFGLIHYYQGLLGIVVTGIFGLLLGMAYLKSGRNLWVTIFAHGLANTLRFTLIFAGKQG